MDTPLPLEASITSRGPVTREPEKIRFVATVCVAVEPELKPASASEVTISAPVNVPASAASECRRRLDDLRNIGVLVAAPDAAEHKQCDQGGGEEHRDLVLERRAEPDDRLAHVRDRVAHGPDPVSIQNGGPRVGAVVRVALGLNGQGIPGEDLGDAVALDVVVVDRDLVDEDVADPD